MKRFTFFNLSFTAAFFVLTFLFISSNLVSQSFQMHYGTELDNSFSKVLKDGFGFYVLGSNEATEGDLHRATVTRLDNNGKHQWTLSTNTPSHWTDAVEVPGGDLIVVGYSLPLNASTKSLIGRVTRGGAFLWLKTYDENGRDFFNRIVEQAGSYYVLAIETELGSSFDNIALWNFSATGILNWKKYYLSPNDDEFVRDLVAIPGGGLLMAGNDSNGVIYTTDNAGEMTTTAASISNRVFRDVEANSLGGFYAVATNFPSGEAYVEKFDASLLLEWEVKIPKLNTITQLFEGLQGNFYVTGVGNFGGQVRNVIIKLNDSPNGPSVAWVKYFHAGTVQTGGSAWYLSPEKLAYIDSRTLPGGFGKSCANLSVSDLDLTDACEVTIEDNASLIFTDPLPDGPPIYFAEEVPPSIVGEITESSSLNWQEGVTCSTARASTSYGIVIKDCKYTSDPWSASWKVYFRCDDSGDRISALSKAFHLQTAVLKPVIFPSPNFTLTDDLGKPVITAAGEEIVLTENTNVAAKIQAISPAPPRYEWFGLQSNALTPSASPDPTSQDFKIVFEWSGLPLGSQDSTGAFWASDDKDDLYDELIIDAYTDLAASTLNATPDIWNANSIRLFPKPTSGDLTLQFMGKVPKVGQLEIHDLCGKVVYKQMLTNGQDEHTLSLENLPGAVYFVKVVEEGVAIWVDKVVKL